MLATELFVKEWEGKDNISGWLFSWKCYAIKGHF